jgi:hypothetical protein
MQREKQGPKDRVNTYNEKRDQNYLHKDNKTKIPNWFLNYPRRFLMVKKNLKGNIESLRLLCHISSHAYQIHLFY